MRPITLLRSCRRQASSFGQRTICRRMGAGAAFLAALLTIVFARPAVAEINWPAWGGPTGTSHSQEKSLPNSWTAADVAWKAPLKGAGQSTPVVWGDSVFLTTAL